MPEIYPVGGGKGGIGKSFVAASLAALIARQGKTVALVDLDLGAANLHTLLGICNPQNGLDGFLEKKSGTLADITVPTHQKNLFLVSSAHCSVEIANLHYAQKTKLINAIKKLPFDYVLLDLGAGSNFNTIDYFVAANRGFVICTVEPTAIENTFRFIKSVYIRRLKQIIKQNNFNDRVKQAVSKNATSVLGSRDIMNIVHQHNPQMESFLKEAMSDFRFKLVINQLRKNTDAKLGNKLKMVCNQHFYAQFEFMGNIYFDERVFESVFQKKLFIENFPNTATTAALRKIAGSISSNGNINRYQGDQS